MRVLTTAIDKGERKVPEGHKVTLYALAPGRALRWNEAGESEVTGVDQKQCAAAEYTYNLKWVEGRTVALFKIGKTEYAQPTKDDPKQKEKRDDGRRDRSADSAGVDSGARSAGAPEAAPRGRVDRPAPRRRARSGGFLLDGEDGSSAGAGGAGTGTAGKRVIKRRRKGSGVLFE